MTIEEMYTLWKKEAARIRQHPLGSTTSPSSFLKAILDIRDSKRSWTSEEIATFKEFLLDYESKWFVAQLFSRLEEIPEELFDSFIHASIHKTDPSSNRAYIEPCLRVFGFERVFESLNTCFKQGDNQTKIGVCQAFYWAHSPIVKVKKGDGPWRTTGYFLKWNGERYSTHDLKAETYYEMTPKEVEECQKITNKLLVIRKKLLIEEFLTNTNLDVRYHIKSVLPKNVPEFTLRHKKLEEDYAKALINDFLPDNYSDLQIRKRLGFLGNNKLLRYCLEKKNEWT